MNENEKKENNKTEYEKTTKNRIQKVVEFIVVEKGARESVLVKELQGVLPLW